MTQFAALLKSAREERGWSQTELAKRSRVALRTIVNIERSQTGRRVRFDVVIRLAAALEKPPPAWLKLAGHEGTSDEVVAQVLKKAGILGFYGEDDPSNFFKMLEDRVKNSWPVVVSMTYCTFSEFAHQEVLAQNISRLANGGRLFLALVCAYPKVADLGAQEKPTLSSVYLQVRSEVIGLTKAIKAKIKPEFQKHVACFSLMALKEPTCFPQVGLSHFRQILIESHPDHGSKPDTAVFDLSTWISFFLDEKERWIRIYPTLEILKSREDSFRRICSAWKDYVLEIHRGCNLERGWTQMEDQKALIPWEIVDIS